MKPEDVPVELMNLGRNAMVQLVATAPAPHIATYEERVRAVLAAVLPAHERQVREQVADEIEARVAEHRSEAARLDLGDRADMLESIGVLAKADHLAEGARIARGES